MTTAPANLLAVRNLLLAHLNVDKSRVRGSDLEPSEVGIVGDANHRGGYHCGRNRVVAGDYSVVESPRDRNGLTLDAAALDVGLFEVRSGGRTHTLASFSLWCVNQCVANAPDTRDIREIIYSPDGRTVRRWDRLKRRTTGDSSHLWHTHFSFFRDAIKAGRDQTPLFRRYLTSIGLLEDDVSAEDVFDYKIHNDVTKEAVEFRTFVRSYNNSLNRLEATTRESLKTAQAALAAVSGVDTEGIKALIQQTAAAEQQRDAELAELVRQAQTGQLDAAEVVRLIGEKLAAAPGDN